MKTKLIAVLFLTVFSACIVPLSNTELTYSKYKKEDKDTTISYTLPVVSPTATTKQEQTQGDITITAEVEPFTTSRSVDQSRTVTFSEKKNYDEYEVVTVPHYTVTPEIVRFNLRIRNHNENANLVLEKVAFSLLIDGTEFSFPDGYRAKYWQEKSMVMAGTEETFLIDGPAFNTLNNPKLIRLRLTGVPTAFDKAGATTNVHTFEWFFSCSTKEVTQPDKITYRYEEEPVYKEQCKACNGIGYYEKTETCRACNGTGIYTGSDGKVYQCYSCKGNKTAVYKYNCSNCQGKGSIALPKSTRPPVASRETWSGWQVRVITRPAGASIHTMSQRTHEYVYAGMSNGVIDWLSPGSTQYPIEIELNGKRVKVLPYTKAGKQSPSIQIDFRQGEPIVKVGRKVE